MCYSAADRRTTYLHSFRDLAMNQRDQDRNNDIPPRSSDDSPAMGQRVYDTARVQRTSQITFIRDRLDQGLSPAAVAGVAAVIPQMESQIHAPMLTLSITSGFSGFQRSMTFQDGVWSGHDLTHHFTDDRAAISYSSANGGVHQTRSMQLPSCPPHLPRRHQHLCLNQMYVLESPGLSSASSCPCSTQSGEQTDCRTSGDFSTASYRCQPALRRFYEIYGAMLARGTPDRPAHSNNPE